jgi:hypothetical protein
MNKEEGKPYSINYKEGKPYSINYNKKKDRPGRNPKGAALTTYYFYYTLTTYYFYYTYTIRCGHSQPPTKRGRPIREATYP